VYQLKETHMDSRDAIKKQFLNEYEKGDFQSIPPTVEYSLADKGKSLIPALESVYQWADEQMK
jgi:hypothetical protein